MSRRNQLLLVLGCRLATQQQKRTEATAEKAADILRRATEARCALRHEVFHILEDPLWQLSADAFYFVFDCPYYLLISAMHVLW